MNTCLNPRVVLRDTTIVITATIAISLPATATELVIQDKPKVKYEAGYLPSKWFSGGPGCATFHDDFQVNKYNKDFYILRESGCVHTEKPFLYLLFGKERAILFDTGAGDNTDPTTGRVPDVAGVVNSVINQWLKTNNRKSIHLVVAHLHSHFDHIWGDPQFIKRPDTTFVKPGDVDTLKAFFGINKWPEGTGLFDLGGRLLDIIPMPGHDATSIAVYDRQTAILLTGDAIYPGRIYVNEPDPNTMQESVQRLVNFTRDRPVAHVLGTHIEQRAPYLDYPRGAHYAPDEVPLQLGRANLLELLEATKLRTAQNNSQQILQKAYRDFTLCGVYPTCEPINAESRTVLINDTKAK